MRFSSPALYDLNDEELMVNVRDEDDQKSFCVLFDRYKGRIYQWLYWNCGARAVAEELTQEIFLKVYHARRGYRPQSFRAWIYTIARNQLKDHWKKRGEVLVDDIDQRPVSGFAELMSEEESLILKQEREEIQTAIEELPERQREAITLWLSEDWSYEQMAVMMDCSEQAVKNLIHRAKRELVDWFKEE